MGMTASIAPIACGSAVQVMGNGMLIPPAVFPLVTGASRDGAEQLWFLPDGRGPNEPRGIEDLAAWAEARTAMGSASERGPLLTGASMAGVLVLTATLRHP